MYRRIPVSQARSEFRDVISRAEFGSEAAILTFRGRDVAAVLPISKIDIKALGQERKAPIAASKTKRAKPKRLIQERS